MGSWSFTLPIDLSSANLRIVNGRHAATAAMYRKRRDTWVSWMIMEARHVGLPFVGDAGRGDIGLMYVVLGDGHVAQWRRRVTITRLMGKRQRAWDDDNLIAACKALRDGMQMPRPPKGRQKRYRQGAAIVYDDSAKWSEWRYAQERSADGKPGVRIDVEDIEPASAPGKASE